MKIENDLNWLEVEVFISAMKLGGQKNTSKFKVLTWIVVQSILLRKQIQRK